MRRTPLLGASLQPAGLGQPERGLELVVSIISQKTNGLRPNYQDGWWQVCQDRTA